MKIQKYMHGFGNYHETEAIPNALVKHKNSPQQVPYGLYAEQISGSAFTRQRKNNLFTWVYRIQPSVRRGDYDAIKIPRWTSSPSNTLLTPPTPMRWDPLPTPKEPRDFIQGMATLAGQGLLDGHSMAAIHLYAINQSMKSYFYNADGELLIVPYMGELRFKTEMGWLDVTPGEIIVLPRGIVFQVELRSKEAKGYVCENFGLPFELPELGLIGANGLARPRDFLYPIAAFEEKNGDSILIAKFQGQFWQTIMDHSPLSVVAWHGNYSPYKYALSLFNTINTVSYDHPDPSIFTVLTSPSGIMGIANVDFVIFPPRWMVAEDTFRPPYFHRNVMSEFMGLVKGEYDAKPTGFIPGSSSLHNCMSPHGPDNESYQKGICKELKPEYYDNTLAFMFESRQAWLLTEFAYHAEFRQKDYLHCWNGLKANFSSSIA